MIHLTISTAKYTVACNWIPVFIKHYFTVGRGFVWAQPRLGKYLAPPNYFYSKTVWVSI